MDYTQVPGLADERGSPQDHRAQTQTGQAFSDFDTTTVNPNLIFMDQNMFDEPAPELGVHESWARAANPQLGPRGSNMHQPSVNTAPPFASRQTTIPRREYHSENSTSIRARFNSQFDSSGFSNVSATSSTYSGQLSNEPSQSVRIAPHFPLVSTYASLNEHPQAAGPQRTPSISQVQFQSEFFDSLPRKRTRGEDYEKNYDVEHSNGLSIAQPHPDSSESVLLEQNRIGFIRYWLISFPEASVFNPKHTESLATLMSVPIETIQQLCNKLLRTQFNHLAGSVGNARFPLEANNPLSVSLLERYVPQDTSSTSEFTAVVHQFPRECGFCNESQFQSWQYRADHLAVHFKDGGKDMKDWRVTHAGGLHNASDDDDDDDGHDDDEGDDNERSDNQDENSGEGAGNDNFQGHGGASNQHPGDSGYGSSGRSGTSSGNVNLSANNYQYTAQSNSSGGQLSINAQEHQEKKHLAPASDKAGRPEAPLSPLQAPTTLPPLCPTKQSDFHNFQGPPPSTNKSILLVREAVNSTGGAKVLSEFASKDIPESKCRESHCKKPTHHHFTEKMKTFTNSIMRKFQPFGKKEVVTVYRMVCIQLRGDMVIVDGCQIHELHRKSLATRSNETVSTLQNPDEISFRAVSPLASSSTLKVSCLEQRLLDAQIPWGTHRFIPADALGRIVTKRAIHEELDRISDLSASDISLLSHATWEYARKIFAILVCIGKGKLVSSFLSEGFTDANLPINIPKGSSQQKKWITPIETFRGWSPRELDDFSRVQWYFLAPIFTRPRTQHYELDDNCVMPFIKDTEHEAQSGGFSDVWEVVIHPAHQKFFDSNENPSVALKRLHSRKEDDFKHEAYMLTALAQNEHHHLIKLLATYKFRGQYHFMFPYANSNLRQYWEQKKPHWSYETLNWILKQMHGIASALHAIHNFHSATPNNQSVHNNSQPDRFLHFRHAVNFGEERFGRHGDLKPENILWVESVPGSLGILQIADLGLGTFHTLGSRSNVEAKSVGGSPTYVPPECALDLPISRAYDIWSLGKAHDEVYDNSFFIVALHSDTGKYAASVRPAVREWIRDLRTHQRGSAFIHDMLDLIEQEMLVVKPQNRITSGRLSQKLKGFATMSAINKGYLFQELAVAKHENEIYCGGIPDFLDLYWTEIEKITGMPIRKKTSSDVPDLSAQPLAACIVTKGAHLCLSATWSLNRESEDDLAQSSLLGLKLASDLNDPILEHFASCMPSTAPTASPIGQIAHPGSHSPSVEGTESDETSSHSTVLELGWVLGSSATSEASQDAAIFGLDQDHDDHAAGIANSDSILIGLELPEEYRDKPFFCDVNDENDADICETLSETLYEHTKLQARANAIPWTPDTENSQWPNSDELALAPSPGPAYCEYYLSIQNYIRRYHKIRRERRTILGSCKAQPTTFGPCDETVIGTPGCQQGISPSAFTQCSSAYIETQGKQSEGCHDKHVERFSDTLQQPKISRPVDCVTYSLETLVSIFHPSFLVSHLSRSSVSTLTTELCAPKDLVYESEHIIGFNLGFGPPIDLIVCPFIPRDKNPLYSYQKREGKDKLYVQESLPIVVNLFSIESHAEDLDAWLDGIINSEFRLSEYVDLMMLRQKDHHFSQVLKALISWYMASKNKLDADVKIAIAFLVAHVLDLVRNAGREFAKYSREFNSTIVVNNHDVTEYEMNMQTQLFERVWASILDANGRMGGLAERLRNIVGDEGCDKVIFSVATVSFLDVSDN
ncbi:hypothetical protein G7Y89_g12953 [Cudoniella acicularis]|uniref:Protein kinase domain-containing protein n=1 Tax=Cudoniella acicularis TaxID=354080 RepID=A0A8H4R9F6_9HELO|nr:hypothetical protein G7Y89_g12953 [Cudoniella acicularis]